MVDKKIPSVILSSPFLPNNHVTSASREERMKLIISRTVTITVIRHIEYIFDVHRTLRMTMWGSQ